MVELVKTDLAPSVQQCVIRMVGDTRTLMRLTKPEIRAIYSEIETMRDRLSEMLDRADHKHV